jgi:hypothetical protein
LRTVESCRARLDARVDIGIERIEALPGPAGAGQRMARSAQSMRERREEITAEAWGARRLVRQSGRASRQAPTRDRLEPVLAPDDKGEPGCNAVERFKRWLGQARNRRTTTMRVARQVSAH